MILPTTIEVEINMDNLITVYESNTWNAMYPNNFENFYTYWQTAFEIFSDKEKAAAWRQHKKGIQQEYEYSMSRKR